MLPDLAALAIVVAAAIYLGWRWHRARHGSAGCDPSAPNRTTQAVSLAQLKATLRR